jgi:4,5-dihydroxyphthalate decarboxylase
MNANPEPVKLHTLLGNYPTTAALRSGALKSDLVEFDFADVKVSNTAFKPLVRESRFDLGELAIVTYLQAKSYGKPYVLMPAVVMGRGQHQALLYNGARGTLTPNDLKRCRIGVRSYTQTTGAWVRGILADDYGVDIHRIRWVTFEDPHVAEYKDPESLERAPVGKQMLQMLLDGEIDAAIFGGEIPDCRLKMVIPNAEAAAKVWARRNGGTPINHMVVIRESISRQRPDVVEEVFRLLLQSKNAAPPGVDPDDTRFGVDQNRRTLQIITDYSVRQGLIPHSFLIEELFDRSTSALRAEKE